MMQLMPHGDYYLWFCDWCDSHNRTLWTKLEKNLLTCAACHKSFPAYSQGAVRHRNEVRFPQFQLL